MIARVLPSREERCGQPLATALLRIGTGMVRRRLLGATKARVEIGGRGVRIEADLETPIGLHVYRHGWCDLAASAVERLAPRGGVVVDGGANIGMFALVAASVVGPEGLVHAVEASPPTARLLRRNVEINPGLRVEVDEVALAEAPGELEFTAFEPGSGSSSFAPGAAGDVIRVATTTLDELTAGLERVDLVKLDLEGAETRALVGAARLIERRRPSFLVELEPDHLARQGSSIGELEELMRGRGYEAFALEPEGRGVRLVPMPSPWRRPAGEPNVALMPAGATPR